MSILIINCGSSSIKFRLYDSATEKILAKGMVSCIGEKHSLLKYEAGDFILKRSGVSLSFCTGFELVIQSLLNIDYGVIKDLSEISCVGHRVVHGGDKFIESTIIDDDIRREIESCIPLAPLHNPANLTGIIEARKILPDIPHVAVFDTAFHQSLPQVAFTYAIPYKYYKIHKMRKYGFHGTSCRYVSQKALSKLDTLHEDVKMVICHLGNGVTIDAVRRGKSVDTSLGFTPIPGVMMGTRSGDIDPGLLFYLNRQLGLSIDKIDNMLNRESGLLGVSGVSNDMRLIIKKSVAGNKRCQLAIEMYTYQIKKYIGSYAAAMGGIDALVFTAGIGENSPLIREKTCKGMEFLGIKLDSSLNNRNFGTEQFISSKRSKVKIMVIPTDEERMIALDTIAVAFHGK